MSKDKYLRLFSCQMEAMVFNIFHMFFVTCMILKIGKYHSDIPQFQLGHTVYSNMMQYRSIACEQNHSMD